MTHSHADLYIAPDGNDRWTGRLAEPATDGGDGPLATITRAQQLIRAARGIGLASAPVTVMLRGGRYFLSRPLRFTHSDASNVTYTAYPGETPILDGGTVIDGWQEQQHNGRSIWSADVRHLLDRSGVFRQFFVNGKRRLRARLPKQGFFRVADDVSIGQTHPTRLRDRFICEPGDVQNWPSLDQAEVAVLHFFKNYRIPITGFDAATRTLRLRHDVPGRLIAPSLGWHASYYIDNLREALTEPGEWYLDQAQGQLYYMPMPDERPDEVDAVVTCRNELLRIVGDADANRPVTFLTLQGLTLQHGNWEPVANSAQSEPYVPGTVFLEAAHHCRIENCTFQHLGMYAIELGHACMGNRLVGNTIHDIGGGGIRVSGINLPASGQPRKADVGSSEVTPDADLHARLTGNNQITDNHIHSLGHVFMAASGILIQFSFGNRVLHNHIHDLYYTAISVGWTWGYAPSVCRDNRIEFNHCHDIGQGVLSDMAGIYTLGVQPGTTIRNNLIHHVTKSAYGGFGINLDEGSSHIVIENNLVHDTSSQSLHQHFGAENIIRNNIFAFGEEGLIGLSRGPAMVCPQKGSFNDGAIAYGFTFMHNILITDRQPLFIGRLGDRSGDLGAHAFLSDLNLYFNITDGDLFFGDGLHGKAGREHLLTDYSFDQWQQLGYDRHGLVDDPRCRNISERDFTLDPQSPAVALGFRPLDLDRVGPRPADQRNDAFPLPHLPTF
ncbi:MAG: right-handed parallel beta-helix repeat-containing protein [Phycisphaeraceae bacterium]